jgi:hypothetical protein
VRRKLSDHLLLFTKGDVFIEITRLALTGLTVLLPQGAFPTALALLLDDLADHLMIVNLLRYAPELPIIRVLPFLQSSLMVWVDGHVGCRVDRLPSLIVGWDSTLVDCQTLYVRGLVAS